jgi:hypothetical protein
MNDELTPLPPGRPLCEQGGSVELFTITFKAVADPVVYPPRSAAVRVRQFLRLARRAFGLINEGMAEAPPVLQGGAGDAGASGLPRRGEEVGQAERRQVMTKLLLDENEVETLGGIAERLQTLWLFGELPSLDELKDWGTALGRLHARMEDSLTWPGGDEDE